MTVENAAPAAPVEVDQKRFREVVAELTSEWEKLERRISLLQPALVADFAYNRDHLVRELNEQLRTLVRNIWWKVGAIKEDCDETLTARNELWRAQPSEGWEPRD